MWPKPSSDFKPETKAKPTSPEPLVVWSSIFGRFPMEENYPTGVYKHPGKTYNHYLTKKRHSGVCQIRLTQRKEKSHGRIPTR
jgi:hypothetical protein